MLKKINFIFLFFILVNCLRAQIIDSIKINYYENYPYAYTENGKLKGIEVDIIEEYTSWLKSKKNINLITTYSAFEEFSGFYSAVKTGSDKIIGLGSVTANTEREKEVLFSSPYLKNIAVLITDGYVPTIKTKTSADVAKILGGLTAIVVNKSSHLNYMNELKKTYLPSLKINFTEKQINVIQSITLDKKTFGYLDIVAYWSFLKSNPTKYLKMQKVFNQPVEYLGFIMPKKSAHLLFINEFFESGFGFTSTKIYHQILEKYLGFEIIESVEIK